MQQIHDLIDEHELTDRQRAGIIGLLSEPTIVKAADSAGVDRSTLYRWMREPDFSRVYREARMQTFEAGIGRLQQLVGLAADTLAEVMQDPEASPASKVAAADKVLVNAKALLDPSEIDREIAELRAMLEGGEIG